MVKRKKATLFNYLGGHELKTSILNVPTELRHGPAGSTKAMSFVYDVLEILFIVGGFVQPQSCPQQLIHVSTHRRIVALYYANTPIIFSLIFVPKFKQLHHTQIKKKKKKTLIRNIYIY